MGRMSLTKSTGLAEGGGSFDASPSVAVADKDLSTPTKTSITTNKHAGGWLTRRHVPLIRPLECIHSFKAKLTYTNLPGFKMSRGSSATLIARCRERNSGDAASGHHGFFARPIPCSPVMTPPHA